MSLFVTLVSVNKEYIGLSEDTEYGILCSFQEVAFQIWLSFIVATSLTWSTKGDGKNSEKKNIQ